MTTRFLSRLLSYNALFLIILLIHTYISVHYTEWAIYFDAFVAATIAAIVSQRYEDSK